MEDRSVNEIVEDIIGDVPVSVQLNTALSRMATKDHTHDNYALRLDFEELKQIVDQLVDLVGDTAVSEQIARAINHTKG